MEIDINKLEAAFAAAVERRVREEFKSELFLCAPALFAELRRLRAIEAAARDAMRQIDRALWDTGCLHDLRNNARICDLRAALAQKP